MKYLPESGIQAIRDEIDAARKYGLGPGKTYPQKFGWVMSTLEGIEIILNVYERGNAE